jgi:hypothetical protein
VKFFDNCVDLTEFSLMGGFSVDFFEGVVYLLVGMGNQ